jgi:hypothetical protein
MLFEYIMVLNLLDVLFYLNIVIVDVTEYNRLLLKIAKIFIRAYFNVSGMLYVMFREEQRNFIVSS